MNTLLLATALLLPQQVDQKAVDEAIKKGVDYLKKKLPDLKPFKIAERDYTYDPLVLWTFIHAGVPESDKTFQEILERVIKMKEETTYSVSLKAMILEELDRVRYQNLIARCAQFLADNQCENGQWSYGDPSYYVEDIPTTAGRKDVATSGGAVDTKRKKPKVTKKIAITQKRKGPAGGDNSNSQYAALGLRACVEAGIVFEKDLLKRAAKWWKDQQKEDGGWCYGDKGHGGHESYGSMTAGALGSYVILKYLLGENWKNDKDVQAALKWIGEKFSVESNPGKVEHSAEAEWMYYYFLYALERAGVLYGTETFGAHEWYPEGAKVLIERQNSDGSWKAKAYPNDVWDTCFAILFLRRATRPLDDVATGK